jgi:hypothetical protein
VRWGVARRPLQREAIVVLADVNLGDLIWTTIWVFFLILFIWVFIVIISDLFRDHKMSGWGKALWVIALILFPLIGCLIYLIARGDGMAERQLAQARATQQQFDDYVRSTAGSGGSSADELAKLADLRSSGTITEEEFQSMKARVVGGGTDATAAPA